MSADYVSGKHDTPGGFFNDDSAHTGHYSLDANFCIVLGTADAVYPADPLLDNLSKEDADPDNGSAAQVVMALMEALYVRYQKIPSHERPTKFTVTKNGYLDPRTNEWVFNYSVRMRAEVDTITAINE